jgi:parvulin-like peptidyl-prolyl isomerase
LARPAGTGTIHVQHVLIGWKDVPAAARRPLDPRAAARSKTDADKLAKESLDTVRAGADVTALMKEFSEDPGSKDDGRTYEVSPSAGLVPPFKNLSLRLELGESGMVITMFGWHVIKRVPSPPPPPPDSLDSVDILKREPVTQKGKVKHILLGWKDVNAGDPRGSARDRAALEKLVAKTVADLKKGKKIEPLMKALSEDPGSAASGEGYDVTPDAGLVPPFKELSLRLNVGEVGVVKTQFGIHIIQRVE